MYKNICLYVNKGCTGKIWNIAFNYFILSKNMNSMRSKRIKLVDLLFQLFLLLNIFIKMIDNYDDYTKDCCDKSQMIEIGWYVISVTGLTSTSSSRLNWQVMGWDALRLWFKVFTVFIQQLQFAIRPFTSLSSQRLKFKLQTTVHPKPGKLMTIYLQCTHLLAHSFFHPGKHLCNGLF